MGKINSTFKSIGGKNKIHKLMKTAGATKVSDKALNLVGQFLDNNIQECTISALRIVKNGNRKKIQSKDLGLANSMTCYK